MTSRLMRRAEKSKKAVSKAFEPIVISSDDDEEEEEEDEDGEDEEDDEEDGVGEATPKAKPKSAGSRR